MTETFIIIVGIWIIICRLGCLCYRYRSRTTITVLSWTGFERGDVVVVEGRRLRVLSQDKTVLTVEELD